MEKLPKVTKAEDTALSSVIDVKSSLVNGIVPMGTKITEVRVIAGYGTSTIFRDAEELSLKFGGDKEKWEKKGGIAETDNFIYDIHWNEYVGIQYNHKVKGVKAKK
ncbi:MAG: hypothetical protein FWD71_12345 [Oscillospiraceae bacterium]|nr:hypothetical protein [Oscillospiraceae bacterium]